MSDRVAAARESHQMMLKGEFDARLFSDDVVYEQHFGVTGGRYEGEAGFEQWMEQLYEVWEHVDGELEDARELGDAVIARFTVSVRSPSGVDTAIHGSTLYRFDESGRIRRVDAFNEVDAAEHEAENPG